MYFKFNIFSRAVGGRALTYPSFYGGGDTYVNL